MLKINVLEIKMKSLKVNAFSAILVRVLNILFPLITGPYIARTLSKNNISIFDTANTLTQFFIPFATFGIYTYGVRAVSKVKNNKKKINKMFSELFILSLFSTMLTAIIYYLYISNFIYYSNNKILYVYYILGLQIIFQFLSIEWINEAFENYSFILYKTIFVRITMFIMVFTFIKSSEDVIPYVLIMTFAELLNMIISFIWIKKDVKIVKVKFYKIIKLISPLFTMVLLSNINMLYTYLDKIFLTKSPISTNISDYVISLNIVMLIVGVISGAISVNIPRLSYYIGENDIKSYENLINKGSSIFLFFVIPISFGLMILGTEATIIYGGDKFLSAGIVTSLFAIRSIIWTLDNIIGIQIMFIRGYEKALTCCIAIGGVFNLFLKYILYYNDIFSPKYYIATTTLAEILVLLMYIIFIYNKKIMKISKILIKTCKYSIIASSFIIISLIINSILPYDMVITIRTLYVISIKIVLCVIIYLGTLYLLKDDVIFEIINFTIKKFKKGD